jgi:hypothetical protein
MVLSPSGGQVSFVGTSAILAGLGQVGEAIASRSFTSVNSAIAASQTGRGDVVYMLPGYTESITADAWSNLAATDVAVVGLGRGTNRPALTWTLAGSTMLFDVANFRLQNCQLFLAGAHAAGAALTVAAPITVTAAGCGIEDCQIYWGFDADQIVTIGITVTTSEFFRFNRVTAYAETAAVPTTTFMRLNGAKYMQMYDTKIQGAGSTTTLGPVQFLTTASLAIDWRRSIIQNQLAASIQAVTGMAGLTGTCHHCGFGILDNATAVGFVTPGNVQFFDCVVSNDNGVGSAGIPA